MMMLLEGVNRTQSYHLLILRVCFSSHSGEVLYQVDQKVL